VLDYSKKTVDISAKASAQSIDNLFNEKVILLDNLVYEIEHNKNYRFNYVQPYLKGLDKKYNNLFYVGIKGNPLISSDGWIPPHGYDYRKEDWYTYAVNQGKDFFIKPYIDEGTGNMVISIVSPIKENGKTIGVAGIDIGLDKVSEMVKNSKIYWNNVCNIC